MDDHALLAAIAGGDDSALRELFDRHAPWLAARLRRRLPIDAVEDVVQETFIAAWRGAATYTAGGAPGAWLWGIARRQAALWARKHDRPEPIFETEPHDDPAATAIHAADVQRALDALGPEGSEGRELIRLVYVEDRPLAEVAGLLRVPPGTVKSRLFKVRSLLRAALGGGY